MNVDLTEYWDGITTKFNHQLHEATTTLGLDTVQSQYIAITASGISSLGTCDSLAGNAYCTVETVYRCLTQMRPTLFSDLQYNRLTYC